MNPSIATPQSIQNGISKCWIVTPTASSFPLNNGPSDRARQPKDTAAPLTLASASLDGAVFVILSYMVNR